MKFEQQPRSLGFIDFGNNDIWEVMGPETIPNDVPNSFVLRNFPIGLFSHDDPDMVQVSLAEFLTQYLESHHLNEILFQLGDIIHEVTKPKTN